MSAYPGAGAHATHATHATGAAPPLVNARAIGARGGCGVAPVAFVASVPASTESDEKAMKKRYIVAGVAVLGCAWGTGIIHDRQVGTVAAIVGAILLAGGVLGGLAGAGHARERRAWADYQDVRAKLPIARRAWLHALQESAARYTLPAVIAAIVFAWWKGRR